MFLQYDMTTTGGLMLWEDSPITSSSAYKGAMAYRDLNAWKLVLSLTCLTAPDTSDIRSDCHEALY